MRRKSALRSVLLHALAITMTIGALFPIYWMFNTSLKTNAEIYQLTPTFWPKKPSFKSYEKLIDNDFLVNIGNSVVVSLVVAVVSVFVSMLAAYAISRTRFAGKRIMSRSVLYAYLMPRAALFIPLYLLVTLLGLGNTLGGLMLIYPTFTIPYATWILIPYFNSVPLALEESAAIDGASRWQSMWKITFPLAAPAIAATTVFSFTLCWSEYLYALVMISDADVKTVPLALADMVVGDVYAWGPLMAGALVASVPVTIMYLIANRYMVSGLTMGSVK